MSLSWRVSNAIRSARPVTYKSWNPITSPLTPSFALRNLYQVPGRAMSTAAATDKFQFMVYCPDKTDEGALQRRLSVRERHLENAKKLSDAGLLKFGRALLSPESISSPSAEQKMVGSMTVLQTSSLEEAKKVVESDIYYTTGVWDPERIVILPFAGLPL